MFRRERAAVNLFSKSSSNIQLDDVTNVINNVLTSDTQLCDKNGKIANLIQTCPSADGVYIPAGIKQEGALVMAGLCFQDAQKTNDLATKIALEVEALAKAKSASSGLLFEGVGIQESDIKTSVKTIVKNNVENKTFQDCSQSGGITNQVSLCGKDINIGGIEQSGSIEMTGDCTQIAETINKIANDIAKKFTLTADSGESWTDMIMAIGVIMVVLAVIGAMALFISSGGGGRRRPPRRRPRYGASETQNSTDNIQAENTIEMSDMELGYNW